LISLIIMSWGIRSKHLDMSPCIVHWYGDPFLYNWYSAWCSVLLGLKLYELPEKCGSQIASSTIRIAFCIIFSRGLPTLSGLISVLPPGLGIITLLVGVKLNFPDFISRATFSNHLLDIPSSVVWSIPSDMFPGLPLISK